MGPAKSARLDAMTHPQVRDAGIELPLDLHRIDDRRLDDLVCSLDESPRGRGRFSDTPLRPGAALAGSCPPEPGDALAPVASPTETALLPSVSGLRPPPSFVSTAGRRPGRMSMSRVIEARKTPTFRADDKCWCEFGAKSTGLASISAGRNAKC